MIDDEMHDHDGWENHAEDYPDPVGQPRDLALTGVTVLLRYQEWQMVSVALQELGCSGACHPGDHLSPPERDYFCPLHGAVPEAIHHAMRTAEDTYRAASERLA